MIGLHLLTDFLSNVGQSIGFCLEFARRNRKQTHFVVWSWCPDINIIKYRAVSTISSTFYGARARACHDTHEFANRNGHSGRVKVGQL